VDAYPQTRTFDMLVIQAEGELFRVRAYTACRYDDFMANGEQKNVCMSRAEIYAKEVKSSLNLPF
jgi:hypothetical protein